MLASLLFGSAAGETARTAAVIMLAMINAERLDAPLTLSDDLQARAERRAQHFCSHPLSHDGWQAHFKGSEYRVMAENLAKDHADAETAQTALLRSAPHRANSLNRDFQLIGIGYACGVYVQFFASAP